MELNYPELVKAIDDQKHARHRGPTLPMQRTRKRHRFANRLRELADRIDD